VPVATILVTKIETKNEVEKMREINLADIGKLFDCVIQVVFTFPLSDLAARMREGKVLFGTKDTLEKCIQLHTNPLGGFSTNSLVYIGGTRESTYYAFWTGVALADIKAKYDRNSVSSVLISPAGRGCLELCLFSIGRNLTPYAKIMYGDEPIPEWLKPGKFSN
jgi:hypothetical protein